MSEADRVTERPKGPFRVGTPDENSRAMERIITPIEEAFRDVADRIAANGVIGVLVLRPRGIAREVAEIHGWDGVTDPVLFRLSERKRAHFIKSLPACGDPVMAAWLAGNRPGHGRFVVLTDYAVLLLNRTPDRFYSMEPGSLDVQRH